MTERRVALQNELSRCERELNMLGMERAGYTRDSSVVKEFKEKLAAFISIMDKVNKNVTLDQVKIATKLWASVFHRFNNRFGELETASPRDTDTKTYSIIDESCLMMELITTAFKDTGGPLYEVSSQMCVGLTRNTEGVRVVMINIASCVEYMSKVFEKLGRCMRQLQCGNTRYYDFLGPEAKKAIISTFDLLDPAHDVKKDSEDASSETKAVTRFEPQPEPP